MNNLPFMDAFASELTKAPFSSGISGLVMF